MAEQEEGVNDGTRRGSLERGIAQEEGVLKEALRKERGLAEKAVRGTTWAFVPAKARDWKDGLDDEEKAELAKVLESGSVSTRAMGTRLVVKMAALLDGAK